MNYSKYFEAQMARSDATDDHAKRKRKPGSCRFDPYYKIEWLDSSIGAYRPLQKQFAELRLAQSACSKDKIWRIYEVSQSSRRLLP